MNFKQCFFKIYDKKIASGEITFSKTGIRKDDFTKMCTEPDFVLSQETLDHIRTTMFLTDEEYDKLVRAASGENV